MPPHVLLHRSDDWQGADCRFCGAFETRDAALRRLRTLVRLKDLAEAEFSLFDAGEAEDPDRVFWRCGDPARDLLRRRRKLREDEAERARDLAEERFRAGPWRAAVPDDETQFMLEADFEAVTRLLDDALACEADPPPCREAVAAMSERVPHCYAVAATVLRRRVRDRLPAAFAAAGVRWWEATQSEASRA